MVAAIVHLPTHVRSREVIVGPTRGACVALTVPITTARIVEDGEVTAWIHGELYGANDADLVEALFAHDAASRLARLNGNFAVAAWHRGTRRVRLAIDRMGLRHLYWAKVGRGIIWASEAKACAIGSPALQTVRADAARELFATGHLHGVGTWFDDIELMPAATLLSFDLATAEVTTERYWTWPESPTLVTTDELTRIRTRLAERWREVHAEHVRLDGDLVLTLSGGLDSRAILASTVAAGGHPHLVTFGRPQCADVAIATTIAARAQLPHDVCELSATNWLDDRALATWITDGQFDLRHMHVVRCLRRCAETGTVVLNGFLGDALLGGGYLSSRWTAEERYRERGRRFISEGTRMGEAFLLHRLPFCDNEIIELSLAIPEALRKDGWFYQQFLRATYPSLFGSIGHTPHGAPLGANLIRRTVSAASLWFSDRYDYHAYKRWVTAPAAAELLRPYLDPRTARFAAVLDERMWRRPVTRWQRCVAAGRSLSDRDTSQVLRLAGMSMWLESVESRFAAVSRPQRDVA